MVQPIFRVVSFSGLSRITTVYVGLSQIPRITLEYPRLLWLPRIIPIYFELLQIILITPDYQFGSPSGPADYLCRFLLRIIMDYFGLSQITRITLDYPRLLWLTQIIPIYFELLQIILIIPDYQFGSPSGSADYQSCFLLGITADYHGLRQIIPDYSDYPRLLRFSWITPDNSDLLRITPDYQFGLPNGPTDYQSCFPFWKWTFQRHIANHITVAM